ncbi:hypothetical protein BDP27DRAFT_1340128, partial [Rhodocollybia butyracea]
MDKEWPEWNGIGGDELENMNEEWPEWNGIEAAYPEEWNGIVTGSDDHFENMDGQWEEWNGITTSGIKKSATVKALRKSAVSSGLFHSENVKEPLPNPLSENPLALHSTQALLDSVPCNFEVILMNKSPVILVSSHLKGLQGYKWHQNSCWADASLEVLYWSFNFFWKDIVTLFESAPGHLFFHVYQSFKTRRTLLMGDTIQSVAYKKSLTMQRNSFRKFIKDNNFGAETGLYGF